MPYTRPAVNSGNTSAIFALGIGFICATIGLWIDSQKPELQFEDAALGNESVRVVLDYEDAPIHITDASEIPELVRGWDERGRHPVALWLGNSQLHSNSRRAPLPEVFESVGLFRVVDRRKLGEVA